MFERSGILQGSQAAQAREGSQHTVSVMHSLPLEHGKPARAQGHTDGRVHCGECAALSTLQLTHRHYVCVSAPDKARWFGNVLSPNKQKASLIISGELVLGICPRLCCEYYAKRGGSGSTRPKHWGKGRVGGELLPASRSPQLSVLIMVTCSRQTVGMVCPPLPHPPAAPNTTICFGGKVHSQNVMPAIK